MKCLNQNCPIVKKYGQICTELVAKNFIPKDSNVHYAKMYTPAQSEINGRYYCYNFGD